MYTEVKTGWRGFVNSKESMLNNKKHNPIVTEFFIEGRKLNISFAFITDSYFSVHTFYYENSKQKRTSINCSQSFIRYWL